MPRRFDPGGGTDGLRPGGWRHRRRSGGNADHAGAGDDPGASAKSTASTGGDRGRWENIRRLAAGTGADLVSAARHFVHVDGIAWIGLRDERRPTWPTV